MPLPDGERLAALETLLGEIRDDVHDLREEALRARGRLHDVEKVTAGLLELQKQMHRSNERRIRQITLAIQFGSLIIGVGMMVLGIATFISHA